MKRRTKIILIIAGGISALLIAVCLVYYLVLFFSPAAPLAEEKDIITQSFDGKLLLVEEHRRVDKIMMVSISVRNREDGTAFIFPEGYRAWDYQGTFWGNDSYDIWTLSSDVGMYRWAYEGGEWNKEYLLIGQLPEDAPQEVVDYWKRVHN